MATKLETYLSSHKIDARRVTLASKEIETHTDACRKLIAQKAQMKAGKLEKNEEVLKQKPRSGRPVSTTALGKAMAGQAVTGPTKSRIVRAINTVLKSKKKGEATFRDLF